jgi:hypothetical protein
LAISDCSEARLHRPCCSSSLFHHRYPIRRGITTSSSGLIKVNILFARLHIQATLPTSTNTRFYYESYLSSPFNVDNIRKLYNVSRYPFQYFSQLLQCPRKRASAEIDAYRCLHITPSPTIIMHASTHNETTTAPARVVTYTPHTTSLYVYWNGAPSVSPQWMNGLWVQG